VPRDNPIRPAGTCDPGRVGVKHRHDLSAATTNPTDRHGRESRVTYLDLHRPANPELHAGPGRDFDPLHGLGILRNARSSLLHLKDAEVSEFQAIPLGQLMYDLVQETLDDAFDDYAAVSSPFGNAIAQLFLAYRCHLRLPKSSSCCPNSSILAVAARP
jgi:hypothetical protein